jgi:hypothetical protein
MKFKIGDRVVCVDTTNVSSSELTLGKNYTLTDINLLAGTVDLINDRGNTVDYFARRFKLASEIEDLATTTEATVEITQSEYDEMQDRIELLESLLVDANKRIDGCEYTIAINNQVITKFFRLTHLVSDNIYVADLIGAKWGDNVVDKIHAYLLNAVNSK